MSMNKVNIILCTYNGEKYIEKQLDSILNQTYQNIDIYIFMMMALKIVR